MCDWLLPSRRRSYEILLVTLELIDRRLNCVLRGRLHNLTQMLLLTGVVLGLLPRNVLIQLVVPVVGDS